MALDGIRMPDGCYADGTWELKMYVTDLQRDVSLRVTGEIHIGGVMLKLVEKLGMHTRLCYTKVRVVARGYSKELILSAKNRQGLSCNWLISSLFREMVIHSSSTGLKGAPFAVE